MRRDHRHHRASLSWGFTTFRSSSPRYPAADPTVGVCACRDHCFCLDANARHGCSRRRHFGCGHLGWRVVRPRIRADLFGLVDDRDTRRIALYLALFFVVIGSRWLVPAISRCRNGSACCCRLSASSSLSGRRAGERPAPDARRYHVVGGGVPRRRAAGSASALNRVSRENAALPRSWSRHRCSPRALIRRTHECHAAAIAGAVAHQTIWVVSVTLAVWSRDRYSAARLFIHLPAPLLAWRRSLRLNER